MLELVIHITLIVQAKFIAGTPLVLNIWNASKEQFTVGYHSTHDSFSTIYTPTQGNTIQAIRDEKETFWRSRDDNEFCSHLVLYGFPDKTILAYLFIVRHNSVYRNYFENNGTMWAPLDRSEFFRKFDGYKLEAPREHQITLDIHSVNLLLFKIINHQPYGANALIFVKKHEGKLVRVSDNREIIWEGGSTGEDCVDVVIYCGGTDFVLGHLFITSSNGFEYRFYEKVEGKWLPLDRNAFYEKLYELDKIEDEKKIYSCESNWMEY
ncbi:conserved hypothetical protein [Theileria equi strain WA]|uniref:Signal peptide-containing protein n=1 Tax=Theileria equi strain WA TaxID=1537102 RepID=L1LBW4_THEEQ|nr:conserved hypothetical protein [Theileria equi strain WA]EKX72937.1 conserved hypothetical protein [Theileria equi strain WA]|eukprot:XP_004832389.1 conserved hypothetical protein [Theileria equi strain WA]